MKQRHSKKKRSNYKFISKYPLSQKEYDFKKTMEKKLSMDFSNQNEDKLDKKIEFITSTSPNINHETATSILNEISKNSDCGPHFLEAYSTVAGKERIKKN